MTDIVRKLPAACLVALSFTQATGIFKGLYTFWYDYESAYDHTTGKSTSVHTSKKAKTYKYKESYPVILNQGNRIHDD